MDSSDESRPTAPPGLERVIWRRIPVVLFWGTALPLLFTWLRHDAAPPAPDYETVQRLQQGDYTVFGFILIYWSVVLTVGIGCVIVMVMKGPVYRGPDPYTGSKSRNEEKR